MRVVSINGDIAETNQCANCFWRKDMHHEEGWFAGPWTPAGSSDEVCGKFEPIRFKIEIRGAVKKEAPRP
jgi:hypothetical protein